MVNTLKFYQDFPKEGIKFVDIIPLMQDKAVYKQLIDQLTQLTTAANSIHFFLFFIFASS